VIALALRLRLASDVLDLMAKRFVRSFGSVSWIALFAACGGSSGPSTPATLATVQKDVFSVSCSISVSCHKGAGQGMLNLESGMTYAQLVNRSAPEKMDEMLVKPGDPDHSYVMDKVLDRNLPKEPAGTTPAWTSMPPGGPMIDANQLEELRSWIADGAKNN
jgi:hypothetical protein